MPSNAQDIDEPTKEIEVASNVEEISCITDKNNQDCSIAKTNETEFESDCGQRETSINNEETCSNLHTTISNSNETSKEENENDEFDFNLDDIDVDENEEIETCVNEATSKELNIADNLKLQKLLLKYNSENQEPTANEIECVESTDKPKKLNKSELLKEKLGNCVPKLRGAPDEIIDLDSGVAEPSEVSKLMERFFKHTSKKSQMWNKVELRYYILYFIIIIMLNVLFQVFKVWLVAKYIMKQ